MVDIEYSTDDYKTIGAIMKSSDIFKFIPDHLQTQKMCKHAVEKLSLVIRYVADRYKPQQMCYTGILEDGRTLESVPDCYKNQQIHDKAVDNYLHALKFSRDC